MSHSFPDGFPRYSRLLFETTQALLGRRLVQPIERPPPRRLYVPVLIPRPDAPALLPRPEAPALLPRLDALVLLPLTNAPVLLPRPDVLVPRQPDVLTSRRRDAHVFLLRNVLVLLLLSGTQ